MLNRISIPRWLILGSIVILAAFVRLYHLDSNPPSPYWEEVALGYDAYSISKTGKDFHGNSYPLIAFPSYGDYKPSGYFYALVPFIKLLGLNVLSVRLPSALAGILAVVLVYLLGKELFEERVGYVAGLMYALCPWAIQFSRGGWEVNLAVTLTLAGAYCLLLAQRRRWFLPLAVISFGLSMFTYHAARLFAPMVGGLGGLRLVWGWRKHFLPLIISILFTLAFVLPFVVNLGNQAVSSRFSQTTVLSDLDPVLKSNAQIDAHGRTVLARLVYHRYWYYAAVIIRGWASHFSPQFLFIRADGNLRHWNGHYGPLYSLDAVFIAVALLVFLKLKPYRRNLGLVILWIILAGIPAALVKPTPHALRFLFAAPGFVLLSAVGLTTLIEKIPRRFKGILIGTVVVAYVYLFLSYFIWYITIYPARAAADWQYGYKEVFASLEKIKKPGELVFMTREQGRPSMFYLFYSVYDPSAIQVAGPSLPKDQLELLQVGDYHFTDTLTSVPGLYAASLERIPAKVKPLDTIRRPDGSVVWEIWRQ